MSEKGVNLSIIETKEELANVLNTCGLPITVIQMILNEIATQVQKQVTRVVDKERELHLSESKVKLNLKEEKQDEH